MRRGFSCDLFWSEIIETTINFEARLFSIVVIFFAEKIIKTMALNIVWKIELKVFHFTSKAAV